MPYHRDDDAGEYGWSQDGYYQQERPATQQRNGSANTGAAGGGGGTAAPAAQAPAQQQQQQPTQAVGIPGRKQRFNEKTTLLSSDDEFQ